MEVGVDGKMLEENTIPKVFMQLDSRATAIAKETAKIAAHQGTSQRSVPLTPQDKGKSKGKGPQGVRYKCGEIGHLT